MIFITQYFHMVTSKKWGTTGLNFGPCSVFDIYRYIYIYINDIDDVVSSKILKFADDTKLYRTVNNQDDIEILRSNLVNLCHWLKDWLMLFNIDKCKTLHICSGNLNELYNKEGRPIEAVYEERDLGIMITKDLKCSKQCLNAVKAANKILRMIKRIFTYKSEKIILQLYVSLARPRLKYCKQAWCPHFRKDIDQLKKVQRRAIRLIYS